MREILFRGKRVDNVEWVYGYYCPCVFGNFPAEPAIIDADELKRGKWAPVKVIPETVGQYTGFTDQNDKKIFEGDIVRFDYVDDEGNDAHEDFLIFFETGAFRAQYLENPKVAPNTLHDDIAIDEGYVVGNKWDNPELLEEDKQ